MKNASAKLFLMAMAGAIAAMSGCEYMPPQETRRIADTNTPTSSQPIAVNNAGDADKPVGPRVLVETSAGNFTVELWPDKAPITVKNFLEYVDEGYYNGTIFHRVMSDFMIQGGGFDRSGREKIARESIKNEATNGCKNTRGTIAMARTANPDSATCQFFINVVDNPGLNHKPDNFGYCVFGKVVDGMETVDKIRYAKTGRFGRMENWPQTPVIILNVTKLN